MNIAACAIGLLAGATMGVHAQGFVNLGFEEAHLPPDIAPGDALTWNQGVPGWSHSAADALLGYGVLNVGYSVSYALSPLSVCCTAGTGSFALNMHSGTLYEQIPRGGFVQAEIWQTGIIPPAATAVSLLAGAAFFRLSLAGTSIDMRPVGLDPRSPSYESDLLLYSGEWRGDVSAFAGRLVELRVGLRTPDERMIVTIDDIRFLPVPEPSTTALLGWGAVLLFAAVRRGSKAMPRGPTPP